MASLAHSGNLLWLVFHLDIWIEGSKDRLENQECKQCVQEENKPG